MRSFEDLFRAHAGQVHRYAQRQVGLDSADDVVAETFVVALRKFERIPEDALPWLLVVARNVIRNQQRHLRRQQLLWCEVVRHQWRDVSAASADEPVLAREAAIAALSQCTDSEREALLLTAWDGLDPASAAAVAGCSARAFTVRLSRARARFDRHLQAHDHPPTDTDTTPRVEPPLIQSGKEKRR